MTTLNDLFPSKYLKASDIPEEEDLAVTITHLTREELGRDEKKESKPIVYFQEVEKGLVLNTTNGKTIANLYGPKVEDWYGKRIALFVDEVEAFGERVPAIRVRLKVPAEVTDRAAKLAKYEQLRDKGATLRMTHRLVLQPLPEDATEADIVAAGKELRAAIAEAENF